MTEWDTGEPVDSLSITFTWHKGDWEQLFDEHIKFIQQDILRALAQLELRVVRHPDHLQP
jgi:hypothetical protein